MSAILVKAELTAEAEDVMQRAVRLFPDSRRVRYKEAEMYRDSGKMQKALDVFHEASQMKAPASMPPELDSLQLSFIYQRIGGINTDLTQFDAAIAAYKKALEISPKNADARMALGDLYLRRGERIGSSCRILRICFRPMPTGPPRTTVSRMQSCKWEIFPKRQPLPPRPWRSTRRNEKRAMSWVWRSSAWAAPQEGQKELDEYSKQEAQAQAQINDQRDVVVSNRGAAALVLNGQAEDAIASFQKSIEAHPGAAASPSQFRYRVRPVGPAQRGSFRSEGLVR